MHRTLNVMYSLKSFTLFKIFKMFLLKVFLAACLLTFVSCVTVDIDDIVHSLETPIGITTDSLVEAVLTMAHAVDTLQVKVESLTRLEERVSSLEKVVLEKNSKIVQMDQMIQNLLSERSESADKGGLRQSANSQNSKRDLDTINCRGQRQAETAAFSVVLSKSTAHIGDKQVIKFDKVLLNDGNAYEPHTGAFTAPMSGTFLFIYSLGHHGTGETWLELVKNGVAQNGVAVEGHFGSQNLQGSNAAILRLSQGDIVLVEAWQISDVTAQSTFTTFSGVFLY